LDVPDRLGGMSEDAVTGRTTVTTEWVTVPNSATTVLTYHAVRANEAHRYRAVGGAPLTDVDRAHLFDNACEQCAGQLW
jgi:hypothetical protein